MKQIHRVSSLILTTMVLAFVTMSLQAEQAIYIGLSRGVSVEGRRVAGGRSLQLDGGDGYVTVPYAQDLNVLPAITIEAWVKRAANRCETVVGNGWMNSYWLGSCNNSIRFYRGSATPVDGFAAIPANQWTHIAVTYDGQMRQYYINGQLDRETDADSGPIMPANQLPLYIGADRDGGYYFQGLIDEVRIWSVVRSQADIQNSLYQAIDTKQPGLLAVWHFDGNANDAVGGHHGTLVANATFSPEGFPAGPPTPTATPTSTGTPSPTSTATPEPTATPSPTTTRTPTATGIPTQTPTSTPITISSVFVETPPNIDGQIGYGEWPRSERTGLEHGFVNAGDEWLMSARIELEHGFVTVANDRVRLYVLIDLPEDRGDDPGDFFLLAFDVDRDGEITPNVDRLYSLQPETGNMRYSFFLGPGRFTVLQPATFSSMARGFGCFIDDGTQSIVPERRCTRHRVWELGIDLAEIGIGMQHGGIARMGLRVFSANPSFTEDIPERFTVDFTNLIEVTVARPPTFVAYPPRPVIERRPFVEVTQAIQYIVPALSLVQDKTSVARVYVAVDNVARTPVQVLLYGTRDGIDLTGSPLSQFHSARQVIDREQLDNTANFLLPETWDEGTIELWTVVRKVFPPFDVAISTPPRRLTFTPRHTPLFWVVPINTGTMASPVLPSSANITAQESYLKTVFPVPHVRFVRRPPLLVDITTGAGGDNIIRALKVLYRILELAWSTGHSLTGSPPFELPEQIIGSYRGSSGAGNSDPIWAGGGGVVSRAEDGAAHVMAHEVNHNLDRSTDGTWGRHVSVGGCIPAPGPDPEWPYDTGYIQEVGFDTGQPWVETSSRTTVIPSDVGDYMGNCGRSPAVEPVAWISPYRWDSLFSSFAPSSPLGMANAPLGQLQQQVQTVYYISGQVNKDGTGNLEPVLVQPGIPTDVIKSGEYVVEVQDASGKALMTMPFFVSFENVTGEQVETAYFDWRLPAQSGTAKVLLKRGEQVLDALAVSENAPTVNVLQPNGGEQWDGLQTIIWSASDLDGDPLWFSILYTPDDGRSWFPVAGNARGESYEVDTSILPGGQGARIRVIATDGFNTATDDSDGTFTVATKSPQGTILLPTDGARFPPGKVVHFEGDATDAEDELIPDDSFIWSFDSTVFGTGRRVEAILPYGVHQVTLTVFDSDGKVASDHITVFVESRIYLPVLLNTVRVRP